MTANDRTIIGVTTMSHALVHTYELSIPILMTIWLDLFSVTPALLGYVVTGGYALFGAGALVSGRLADTVDSGTLMGLCLAGMAGSFVLLAAAPGVIAISLALLVWGAAASIHHPVSLALISRGVTRRGEAFGYHGMAGNTGIAFGPLLTSLLLISLNWRWVALLLALPATVGSWIAFRARFEEGSGDSPSPSGGLLSSLGRTARQVIRLLASGFLLVFLVAISQGLYYRGFLTFLPELFSRLPQLAAVVPEGLDLEGGRYLYVALLMVGIFGQYVGGKLVDRTSPEWAAAAVFPVLAVLAGAFALIEGTGLTYLLTISGLLGLFMFLVQPLYQAAVADYTPADQRGLAYGIHYLGVFGVGAGGAALTGYLLTYYGQSAMFLILAGLAVASTLLAVALGAFVVRPPANGNE